MHLLPKRVTNPFFLVILVGTLAISACGQASSTTQESSAQIWREFVLCARTHGDPTFPDPTTIDSQGRATFPPQAESVSDATKLRVREACQSIYNRLPPVARAAAPVDIQMEIKWAQCMRTHGLPDWPDPRADGSYVLPQDLTTDGKSGPVWQRITAARRACRAYNPSGSF
jgi:hypothetical protein